MAEERKRELEMLLVRKQADAIFADNEAEKSRRKVDEAKDLQNFHVNQLVSVRMRLYFNFIHYFLSLRN